MLSNELQKAINDQINMEFNSAYVYLGMAAYCERMNFRGFAKWLRIQSSEEVTHGMKLFDFMANRDANIRLETLPAPAVDYESPAQVFEAALKHEQNVTASINDLYDQATKNKEFTTAVELHWFLMEQVEEEKNARDIVTKFRMVKGDPAAVLDIDRDLSQRQG